MRFASCAFIASTVALLSLVTPVVNADSLLITSPSPGQKVVVFSSLNIIWTIEIGGPGPELPDVDCDIGLLHSPDSPSAPQVPFILQSGVALLAAGSNGLVNFPEMEARDDYFIQLQSSNGTTVFGTSGHFSIVFP